MYPRKLTRRVICNYDEPVVQIKNGKLRGLIVEGAYIFRGIRYAEAKRFHMPEPIKPWEGIVNAIQYGPVCKEMQTPIAHDEYYVPHFHYIQDEACQYLNVWTQRLDENAKKPVLFWIHGGGYSTGSSVELYAYDGEDLSRFGDVVVVSVNHRLNCIGYLDLSDFGEEYKYSGNAGMADLVEALRWVHDNIAYFGGDPDNVTILGQSGGGGKVATLIQTPAADGLFHKAIIESGMTDSRTNYMQKDAKAFGRKVVEELGLTKETIKEIEEIPYYKLVRAVKAAQQKCAEEGIQASFSPVYDGDYFMGNGLSELGFRPETKNIPVIIGSNLGEFSGNATANPGEGCKNDWSEEEIARLMRERYGDAADTVAAAFKKAYPCNCPADAIFVDTMFRRGVIAYANGRAAAGCAPVYTYMFDLEMPYLGGTLAWHNAEEAYIFHNAEYLEASYIPGVSEWMQDMMTGAWVAFAYTGDPNHPGMPIWYPAAADRDATMMFDEEPRMQYDYDKELMASIPGGRRFSISRKPAPEGGGPRQSF